jgi:hypothetical protein
MQQVDCDDGGEIKEFEGCRVDINWALKTLKLTQPVLLQQRTLSTSYTMEIINGLSLQVPMVFPFTSMEQIHLPDNCWQKRQQHLIDS